MIQVEARDDDWGVGGQRAVESLAGAGGSLAAGRFAAADGSRREQTCQRRTGSYEHIQAVNMAIVSPTLMIASRRPVTPRHAVESSLSCSARASSLNASSHTVRSSLLAVIDKTLYLLLMSLKGRRPTIELGHQVSAQTVNP